FGPFKGQRAVASNPALLTLDLTKDRLACPSGMAWSPDGGRLAVTASAARCGAPSGSDTAVVALYDTRTGKLARRIEPDALLASLGVKGRTGGAAWSPDGETLAFSAVISPAAADGSPAYGLLLVSVLRGEARLITGPAVDVIRPQTQVVWDTTAGQSASVSDQPLPLALSYRWTTDGHLVPEQPLQPGPAPGSFTGSPSRSPKSASIARWQSGTMETIPSLDPNGNPGRGLPIGWYLSSVVPAWSADGRYFTEVSLNTRLVAPGASPAPLQGGICGDARFFIYDEVCAQAGTALPDRALAAALAAAQADQSTVAVVSADWRPDGKVLAVADSLCSSFYPANVNVTLLSTATGQPLAVITAARPYALAPGCADIPGVPYTAWSPSGRQLAFMASSASRITLWSGSSLAALPR
ncbi:MAG TPA: hypothetical protein VF916_00225, partial [Ktedonobacterales bacterium]